MCSTVDGGREMKQRGFSAARWPNYPYAIKVIKAIIRRVKRLRENASSGRMGCWAGTQQQQAYT